MATSGNRRDTALKEAMTKTQLLNALSESTGLGKKEVALVLDKLAQVVERHIRRRAVGTFTLPGMLKIKAVRKPATKARKMISPFSGEEITVPAKPASRAVKVQRPERAQAYGGVGWRQRGPGHGLPVPAQTHSGSPGRRPSDPACRTPPHLQGRPPGTGCVGAPWMCRLLATGTERAEAVAPGRARSFAGCLARAAPANPCASSSSADRSASPCKGAAVMSYKVGPPQVARRARAKRGRCVEI